MAGIAQRISKQTVMRRQTGLGNVGSATGQVIRRENSTFQAPRDAFKSNEIVSHHQSTGASLGMRKPTGQLNGELSAGTYQMIEEGMLEAVYATAATITGTDIAAVGDAGGIASFTSGASGFLTSDFKIGMVVRATGFTGGSTNSNSRNFWISGLTAGTMTGIFLDGTLQVADAAAESVTIAEQGKRCLVPLTGHVKQYLQVEEWYGDLTDSDLFNDVIVGSVDYDLPPSGNAKFSASFVGLGRTLSGAQVMSGPTAETTTGIMSSINGLIYVNGSEQTLTGLKISLKNGAAHTGAEIGSNSAGDVSKGVVEVEGSFTSQLRDQVVSALFEAETEISIASVLTADQTATSEFKAFTIGKVRITSDPPDDNASISRTYSFVARLNPTGTVVGTDKAWDSTIFTVQDSDAA